MNIQQLSTKDKKLKEIAQYLQDIGLPDSAATVRSYSVDMQALREELDAAFHVEAQDHEDTKQAFAKLQAIVLRWDIHYHRQGCNWGACNCGADTANADRAAALELCKGK